MKVTKELRLYKSISLIATYMLLCLRRARTILIYKYGDPDIVKNWRPITINSVLCRIIERVLDIKLRSYLDLNINQRGFMSGPGVFLNFSIVDGCLNNAKINRKDCCVVFLDISKVFDHVSHKHIEQTINNM